MQNSTNNDDISNSMKDLTTFDIIDLREFLHDVKKDVCKEYKVKRNEMCVCGSGKKFKQCCARLGEEHLYID